MNAWLAAMILSGILAVDGSTAGKGPEVLNLNQRISINADRITLGRLLQLWDQATGMQSTVPPELENQILSVHFRGLSISDAVRKIFDGQSVDYVLIEGEGIVVTGRSQEVLPASQASVGSSPPEVAGQPVLQETPRSIVLPPQQEPTIIPTPFGPLLAPSGNQTPFIQLPPVPGAPPPLPFFKPEAPTLPAPGSVNVPAPNSLFGPFPVYQSTVPQWGR
jgi:hypothetical protein